MFLPEKASGALIQVIVTVIGNILCLNFGMMFGATASQIKLYESAATPLSEPLERSASNWIFVAFFLGAAIGALISGPLTLKAGPKTTLLVAGLLQMLYWGTEHFAYDITHIYFSRAFGGCSGGIAYVVLPIFLREVAQEWIYGSLLATVDLCRAIGVLAGYYIANFASYELMAIIGFSLATAFQLLFPFSQEAPSHFMRTAENAPKLEKSLRWYRGIRDLEQRNDPQYLQELAQYRNEMNDENGIHKQMPRCYLLRAGFYYLLLLLGAQFSGPFLMLYYGPRMLGPEGAATLFSTEINYFILTVAQIVGALTTIWSFQKVTRKKLLVLTSFISGLMLSSLVIYLTYDGGLNLVPWAPITLLSIHMLSAHMGLYPLTLLLPNELFCRKLRAICAGIGWTFAWTMLSVFIIHVNTNTFESMSFMLYFAAACCFVLTVFGIFLLPETFGKTLEELQGKMGYVVNTTATTKGVAGAEGITYKELHI